MQTRTIPEFYSVCTRSRVKIVTFYNFQSCVLWLLTCSSLKFRSIQTVCFFTVRIYGMLGLQTSCLKLHMWVCHFLTLLQQVKVTFAKLARQIHVYFVCLYPPYFPVPRLLRALWRVALKITHFCLKRVCAGQSIKCKGCSEGNERHPLIKFIL